MPEEAAPPPSGGVQEYYAGKSVLVTGASGFMGKVLVEKLLRSTDVARVYILLRDKRAQTAKARLSHFVNSEVFDRLRDEKPGALRRIRLVPGDLLAPALGLREPDRQELCRAVQVLFHAAANVRFDQKLKDAVQMNTAGTEKVLKLAAEMEKLEVVLHISTAYSHCSLDVLEEKVYPREHPAREVLNTMRWMPTELVEKITPELLGEQPNTYAYTKCLTEELVASYQERFPIIIARPSIVTASWREPMPGWVENLNGPTGLLVGAGKGVIRSMLCREDYSADLVPVDVAINACILLARNTALEKRREVQVCNIAENASINPITWGHAIELGRKHVADYPFSLVLWYPGGSLKRSRVHHAVAHLLLHLMPAYFIDLLLAALGKKPFMVKVQKRVSAGLQVLQYYTMKQWKFNNHNFDSLRKQANSADNAVFYTDMRKLDWSHYIRDYILGARQFCCKEGINTLPKARTNLTRLYWLDRTCTGAACAAGSWLLWRNVAMFARAFELLASALAALPLVLSPLASCFAQDVQ